MHLGSRVALIALVTGLFAAPAHAQFSEFVGPYPWSYTVEAGGMVPAGAEGSGLESGPILGAWLGYEISPAFIVGPDFSFVASQDPLRTRIAAFGVRGRISPNVDVSQVYVFGGLAAHAIFFNPPAGVPDPPSRLRLGGSFGFGADLVRASQMWLGIEGSYHGIIFASGDALSYFWFGAYVSLRPGEP